MKITCNPFTALLLCFSWSLLAGDLNELKSSQTETPTHSRQWEFFGWVDGQYLDSDAPGQSSFFNFSHLYLSLEWNINPSFRALAEVEYEKLPRIGTTHKKAEILIDRAYLEYKHSQALKLRLGKFTTPAGIWKELHWSFTVDTTEEPIMEENAYVPQKSEGLGVFGSFFQPAGEWQYALLLVQSSEETGANEPVDGARGLGGDLNYSYKSDLKAGYSFYNYKDPARDQLRVNAWMVYLEWFFWKRQLLWRTEFLRLKQTGEANLETFYSKLKLRLTAQSYVNYRYDSGDDKILAGGQKRITQTITLGYSPTPSVRIRLEYAHNRIDTSERPNIEQWSLWAGWIF